MASRICVKLGIWCGSGGVLYMCNSAQRHAFAFDTARLATGMYLLRVTGERFTDARSLTVVR